jgi:hypothetical protein
MNGRRKLDKSLNSFSDFSPLSCVIKSEISARMTGLLKHAAIINGGNSEGAIKHLLFHTSVGKSIVRDFEDETKGFILFSQK